MGLLTTVKDLVEHHSVLVRLTALKAFIFER